MSSLDTTQSMTYKIAVAIGSIGAVVAAVSLICMTEPSLRQDANGYLIIGAGLMVLAGTILAVPIIWQGLTDLWRAAKGLKH